MLFDWKLLILKTNFFQNKSIRSTISVKKLGSRPGSPFCQACSGVISIVIFNLKWLKQDKLHMQALFLPLVLIFVLLNSIYLFLNTIDPDQLDPDRNHTVVHHGIYWNAAG